MLKIYVPDVKITYLRLQPSVHLVNYGDLFQFVLTDVLGQKNELMEEWMKYRKLYII